MKKIKGRNLMIEKRFTNRMDIRSILTPSVLVFFSGVINTIFQYNSSDYTWSPFYIFSVQPSAELIYSYLFFYFFFFIGVVTVDLVFFIKRPVPRLRIFEYEMECSTFKKSSLLFFVSGVLLYLTSQYFMGSENVYNLYVANTVSAKDIEETIKNSPLGIHGVLLLWAYAFIIYYGVCKQSNKTNLTLKTTLVLSILVFVSSGKLQSLLYLFFAMFFYAKNRIGLLRFLIVLLLVIILFAFTRIVRNPDQDMGFDMDFLFLFIGGFYFGSPVVNTTYLVENDIHNLQYIFTWLVPQKLLPTSDVTLLFPDQTSPIGFFGTALISFGYYGVIYTYAIGILSQVIHKLRFTYISLFVFYPFLFMSCFFSMMYNNFMNLTFFIIPLLFALIIPKVVNLKVNRKVQT